jgi:hypothetical protein
MMVKLKSRASGGIGRRTTLKMWRLRSCEFESRLAHVFPSIRPRGPVQWLDSSKAGSLRVVKAGTPKAKAAAPERAN